MSTDKWDKVDKAYEFLIAKERENSAFSVKEIAIYSGWKEASVRTYFTKRWYEYIERQSYKCYKSKGVSALSKEEFRDLHSQKLGKNLQVSGKLPKNAQGSLLDRAREFAILAVSIYNNPAVNFKTYSYIVNITVAWTSLFHAIFEKREVDYFYKDKNGNDKIIDGEKKPYELARCCKEYWGGVKSPVKSNLDFLVGLSNKIENRLLSELDFIVAGECQSCLTNFENLIVKEFGDEYSLNTNLAISLQLSQSARRIREQALKAFQSQSYDLIRRYIRDFQDGLDDDIRTSQEYRLSVFLVPKLKNHAKSSDLTIEFINAESGTDEEYENAIAFIKGDTE